MEYNENSAIRKVRNGGGDIQRVGNPDIGFKNFVVARNVGIRTWGAVDYLIHYWKYTWKRGGTR